VRQPTEDRVRALDLGADDYLPKPFSYAELLSRVQAVLRRTRRCLKARTDGDVVVGDLRVSTTAHEAWLRGVRVPLAPAEYRLLHHLARTAGRLLPHRALIEHLWGHPDAAGSKSLSSLVRRLRTKLERTAGTAGFLESERGLGYRLVRPTALVDDPSGKELR